MLGLPGYRVTEEVFSGVRTVIYRGYDERQQRPVIVKVINADYPSLEDVTRLRNEYAIAHGMEGSGIVKSYKLENYRNSFALVMEDFGGESLDRHIGDNGLNIEDFLKIAIGITEGLRQVHENAIIHKDIKPSNIIINRETGQVKITDFSIASRLSVENTSIATNPTELVGTLAYMSPEQTGRMNRSVDYRTDFYSLGVTFYEMLTGQLPFTTEDPMDLVHCHLAKEVVPPHQLKPEIPEVISDIILKLTAKTAEARYQSAAGLKYDLETCQFQLQSSGRMENFVLASRDRGNQLLIPQKLYGREEEVATLLAAFDRISSGTTEMMLVSGYSGIGKTSIVNEVHKPIVRQRGYFISGKFDQFRRNIPYAALVEAFSKLMRQLLTETAANLEIWKQKLLGALGSNGQVIVDVIPEVELIIGPQPEIPELGPTESQNRFSRVFQQFLGVFCQPEHPLVMFLDDLQWVDSASLKLLYQLTTSPDRQYLLAIGAYRDNEVSPTHPLIQTLEKLQADGAVVNNIVIQPLSRLHVNQLVADTIHESAISQRLDAFSELVFSKTQGNPFFLTQLLKALYSEGLLGYDVGSGTWQWDIAEIQAVGTTDYSVVELVARAIQKLSPKTQHILKMAACIGNRFNLEVLAIVSEASPLETGAQLWEALQAGLILPLSESYKIPLVFRQEESAAMMVRDVKVDYRFLHDRVQQAAYSLIPEADKKATHLKIGQLLLENTTPAERQDNIFAIVNQLNFGTDLLQVQAEKDALAELNLIAGQKAKAATAYEAALRYLHIAFELLGGESWERNYDLTLGVYVQLVEAEYLNGNFEPAKQLSELVLRKAKTLLEQVKIYEIKIQSEFSQFQMQAAIDTALPVLETLGVSLATSADTNALMVGIQAKLNAENKQIQDLADLPPMTDPYKLAAVRILLTVISAIILTNPAVYPLVVLNAVHLCINYGNPPQASGVYAYYGMYLCTGVGDLNSGYQFGKLAVRLLEKLNARELTALVLHIDNAFIKHWKEPARDTIELTLEGFQAGLETGNIEYAGYNALDYCMFRLFAGEHLISVENDYAKYAAILGKLKQEYTLYYTNVCRQIVLNFAGKAENKLRLISQNINVEELLPKWVEAKNYYLLFIAYLAKTILAYSFGDYGQAIDYAREGGKYEVGNGGLIVTPLHNFYQSLSLLGGYNQAQAGEQEEFLAKIQVNQEQMKVWAENAPANYQHKYDLVEAEKSRVLGDDGAALSLYERAITGAKKHQYIQEEAIACERAGEFHLKRGQQTMGRFYLTEAYYGYIRWGAVAKVKDLEERHPKFLAKIAERNNAGISIGQTTVTSTGGSSQVFDVAAVIKASQAISGEIVISELLEQVMKIVLQNAGAQKGCLILYRSGNPRIEAAGAVQGKDVTVQKC
ncbi:MAG: AAA family ATPase [Oscillatoriaceae cyanobacterium]